MKQQQQNLNYSLNFGMVYHTPLLEKGNETPGVISTFIK